MYKDGKGSSVSFRIADDILVIKRSIQIIAFLLLVVLMTFIVISAPKEEKSAEQPQSIEQNAEAQLQLNEN